MVGEKVWVWLNGELVVNNVTLENYWERNRPIYPIGQIELQHHGSRLWFKNIYVREIGRAAETTAKSGSTSAMPTESSARLAKSTQRAPTLSNVAYGTHPRQVLDFWKAESSQPTPLLFHIHGGGWVAGDKAHVDYLDEYLAAGISVVSINYRYVTQAIVAGVKPPVKWPLEDAARALQFVRSKAASWKIDKARIGATGGSAGACSSLWLAFHDDMADPKSADPWHTSPRDSGAPP